MRLSSPGSAGLLPGDATRVLRVTLAAGVALRALAASFEVCRPPGKVFGALGSLTTQAEPSLSRTPCLICLPLRFSDGGRPEAPGCHICLGGWGREGLKSRLPNLLLHILSCASKQLHPKQHLLGCWASRVSSSQHSFTLLPVCIPSL